MNRQSLEDFLLNFGCEFVITSFNLEAPETFTAEIKTKASEEFKNDYPSFCTEWLRKFSIVSQTNWIVRRTFPNVKHLVFKKRYVCQHSAKNKRSVVDRSSIRNKQCPAKIDFVVKYMRKDIFKRDKVLQKGLDVAVIIIFTHTHELKIPEASRFLRCDPEVDEQFLEYFEKGMTPIEARAYHQSQLIANNHSPETLENIQINPSKEHVYYLHRRWKKTWITGAPNEAELENISIELTSSDKEMSDNEKSSRDDENMSASNDQKLTDNKCEALNIDCDPIILCPTEKPDYKDTKDMPRSEEFTNKFVRSLLNLQYAYCEFSTNMTQERNPASLSAIQHMTKLLCSLKTPEAVNKLYKIHSKENKSDSVVEKGDIDIKIEAID